MKVFVIGAGGQGGPCASILAKDKNITEIVLGDINLETAKLVEKKIGSSKLRIVKADASSAENITEHARGMDVLIDLVIPEFSANIMKAALAVNAHYVSTAFDNPFWDELLEEKNLSFDNAFKTAGLTAILGCGMAPGFINIVAKHYVDKLDTVESVKFKIAKKKLGVEEMLAPWNPGWSPKQALIDCDDPAYVFKDGKLKEVAAYSELEAYDFPEPLGSMKVTQHSHEEPLSFARTIGKGLQYCDFKYYLSPQPAAYITAGLVSTKPVEVNGVSVVPLDLLVSLLPKTENAFLNEDISKYEELDRTQFVCLMADIKGTINGKEKAWKIHMPKLTANGSKLYELFGTSLVNVALPAVIAAKMAFEGASIRGVVFPEELDSDDFLKRFLDTGIPYKWEEM